ncbi:apoptotic protease-activating factor 1-like [Lytechinus variegatus]|uniref:apoptotic protease-activating factor 1-like n=1 Tax=Lytechinus variegatus TaxID=7654 RepID=UPI001BB0FBF4|nr:apoptotic protease-activating factor 1-like [Lytechinus variegatus]XP_041472198.1 apoptotic protease-activating factor 1-like [Lytechinus variegatus]
MGDANMAPMTELARLNLRRHRQSLIDDLDVEFIYDHLIAEMVLEIDDVELIMSKATRRRKAVTFLNMITTKGQHAYNCTYTVLKKMQPHLALFLEDAVTGQQGHLVKGESLDGFTKAQADIALRKGGVPIPPSVFTPRPNHIVKIKEALMKLKSEPGWCVVHGMGGIGKSVLAAAAVRDTEILSDVFPGGLFWVSIGNVDKVKLLSKVQNLCARLDEGVDRSPPHNLEEGKDRLRALFIDKHPRSLLILDDVWSTRVLHTFDVQARVMVTTRDRGVTDRVTGPVHRVQLEEGFSEEQALSTLAAWTHQQVDTLPPEAKEIYEASKGSPLVISIIGALLADHPNRWKYYLDKLTRKRYGSLKKVTAYEYGSVGEAMGMSLEQLPEELRDVYKSFAIFAEDVPIPASVLGVMHGEEQESIEDMMEEIINKSLAFQEWNTTYKCQMYTIHDLQLDFLTEEYKKDIQDMNKKLVNAFKNHCKSKYYTLPDDGYIHMYLAGHMAQAEEFAELQTILTCLRWITNKVSLTGPANTLSDYVSYKKLLSPQAQEIVSQFQYFVSVNAHLFMQSPLPDICQLALLQPNNTEVCQQSRQLVKTRQDDFYVEWCNKYLVRDSLLMTNTPHSGGTTCAQFNSAGNRILSCGEDGYVKLWSSESGKSAFSVEAHNNWVNWCELSPDGSTMVTCSNSNVKLWRIANGGHASSPTMIRKIPGDWLRAIFSHDGTKIAMCSIDGLVEILDLKEDRRRMIRASESVIRSLCYTLDDRYIISCSDDTIAKVFDASTPKSDPVVSYSGHTTSIISASPSPDGQYVATTGGSDIHVWTLVDGGLVGKCMSEANSVLCCEFCPKGDIIAGGLSSYEIVLWETRRYKPVAVYKGHTSWVMSVKFDVKGERLVSASDDETVRTWKVEYGHGKDLNSVWKRDFTACFCEGEKRLKFVVAGDNKNRCLVTDGRNADQTRILSEESRRIRAFALSSDNTKVAYGSDGGAVKVANVESHAVERSLDAHSKEVRQCLFTSEGYTLITCSNDSLIKIWPEGREVIVCKGHTQAVTQCQLFEKDTRILSSSHDATLKIWELSSGNCLATIEAHSDWIFMCSISPDYSLVASVSVDKTAKVWDLQSHKLKKVLDNHNETVRTCRFSPDCTLLATGDDNGIIRIWNISTGIEVGECHKHKSWVTDIKFSPDATIVMTAGENVRWWQLDGTPLQTFHVRGTFTRQVQASPSFQTFVTIDSAGILYLMCRVKPNSRENGDATKVVYV